MIKNSLCFAVANPCTASDQDKHQGPAPDHAGQREGDREERQNWGRAWIPVPLHPAVGRKQPLVILRALTLPAAPWPCPQCSNQFAMAGRARGPAAALPLREAPQPPSSSQPSPALPTVLMQRVLCLDQFSSHLCPVPSRLQGRPRVTHGDPAADGAELERLSCLLPL